MDEKGAMKTIGAVVFMIGLAVWPAAAFAECTTTTIVDGGQVHICTECCFNSVCHVTCT